MISYDIKNGLQNLFNISKDEDEDHQIFNKMKWNFFVM